MSVNRQYGESTPKIKTGFVEYENFDWSTVHRKTSACGVYVFNMGETPYCKIGSTGAPKQRLEGLRSGIPFDITFPYFVTGKGGMSHVEIELTAQKMLSDKNKSGEWFECTEQEAISAIRSAVATIKPSYE